MKITRTALQQAAAGTVRLKKTSTFKRCSPGTRNAGFRFQESGPISDSGLGQGMRGDARKTPPLEVAMAQLSHELEIFAGFP
jgi:hypothetical protein